MGKPTGLAFTVGPDGLGMRIKESSALQDKIWDAVEMAVLEGCTVEQFKNECAEAWAEALRRGQEDAARAWSRP